VLTDLRAEPTAKLKFAIEAASFADNDFTKTALKAAIRSARARAVLTHGGTLNLARFSPDGTQVLTAGAGGAILWQLDPPALFGQIAADRILIGAAFSAGGIETLSDDGRAAIWNTSGNLLEPLPSEDLCQPPRFLTKESPEGALQAYYALLASSARASQCSAFSAEGSWAAFWSNRGSVRFFYLGQPQKFGTKFSDISYFAFSEKGSYFAVIDNRSNLSIGHLEPFGQLRMRSMGILTGTAEPMRFITLSPNGDLLVTAQEHALSPTLWDLGTGAPRAVLRGHEDRVLSAVFSTDGRQLATTSADGTARVWDVATGKETMILQGHRGAVTGAAFSSDGHWLVTSGADNTAHVWDLHEPDLPDDSVEALLKQAKSRLPVTLGSDGKPATSSSSLP
jgi:WD40 repeat protein